MISQNVDHWTITESERTGGTQKFNSLNVVNNKLSGQNAKTFLMQFNLQTATLARIWQLADVDQDGYLNLKEFLVAIKLVQICLKGLALPTALPPSLLASASAPPNVSPYSSKPAKSYDNLSELFSSTLAVESSVPPQPVKAAVSQTINFSQASSGALFNPRPATFTKSSTLINSSGEAGPFDGFAAPVAAGMDANSERYLRIFSSMKSLLKSNKLTGIDAREIFFQSGLSKEILASIWTLSDVDQDGQLSQNEFISAMSLIEKHRNGQPFSPQLSPPSQAPINSNLSPSLESNAFGQPANPTQQDTFDLFANAKFKISEEGSPKPPQTDVHLPANEITTEDKISSDLSHLQKHLTSELYRSEKVAQDLKNKNDAIRWRHAIVENQVEGLKHSNFALTQSIEQKKELLGPEKLDLAEKKDRPKLNDNYFAQSTSPRPSLFSDNIEDLFGPPLTKPPYKHSNRSTTSSTNMDDLFMPKSKNQPSFHPSPKNSASPTLVSNEDLFARDKATSLGRSGAGSPSQFQNTDLFFGPSTTKGSSQIDMDSLFPVPNKTISSRPAHPSTINSLTASKKDFSIGLPMQIDAKSSKYGTRDREKDEIGYSAPGVILDHFSIKKSIDSASSRQENRNIHSSDVNKKLALSSSGQSVGDVITEMGFKAHGHNKKLPPVQAPIPPKPSVPPKPQNFFPEGPGKININLKFTNDKEGRSQDRNPIEHHHPVNLPKVSNLVSSSGPQPTEEYQRGTSKSIEKPMSAGSDEETKQTEKSKNKKIRKFFKAFTKKHKEEKETGEKPQKEDIKPSKEKGTNKKESSRRAKDKKTPVVPDRPDPLDIKRASGNSSPSSPCRPISLQRTSKTSFSSKKIEPDDNHFGKPSWSVDNSSKAVNLFKEGNGSDWNTTLTAWPKLQHQTSIQDSIWQSSPPRDNQEPSYRINSLTRSRYGNEFGSSPAEVFNPSSPFTLPSSNVFSVDEFEPNQQPYRVDTSVNSLRSKNHSNESPSSIDDMTTFDPPLQMIAVQNYASTETEFSFEQGLHLSVLFQSGDYYYAEINDVGDWFPTSHVREAKNDYFKPHYKLEKFHLGMFEYEMEQDDDLAFKKDDLMVELEDLGDWIRGYCSGRSGLFPKSFTQPMMTLELKTVQTVKQEYQAIHECELTINTDSKVGVLHTNSDGWCVGVLQNSTRVGFFPANCITAG